MWTTDTFPVNMVNSLCLKWTKTKENLMKNYLNDLLADQQVSKGGGGGGLREDFPQRPEAARGVWRAGGLREDFPQRAEAARGVGRAGGLREDFPQRPEAARGVGRAGGLREDFHQRPEGSKGVGRAHIMTKRRGASQNVMVFTVYIICIWL